jgi:hypothetical protein
MILIFASIPLMVLALVIATVPVLLAMRAGHERPSAKRARHAQRAQTSLHRRFDVRRRMDSAA